MTDRRAFQGRRRAFLLWLAAAPLAAAIRPGAPKARDDLAEKFPSHRYVMETFDIDPAYIHDPWFVRFVTRNEKKYRRFYEHSLKRGERYIPLFKDMLGSKGLSHLFVYLSMTESGFKPQAVSSKKAAGLWQFMAATARRFHLKVDKHRDERYDPVASTKAAMEYLQTLYRMFGKWYLVMMAYNAGEGRIQRAIRRAGTDDFATLMDEKAAYLPKETRNYLRKILLLSMMGERITTSTAKKDITIRQIILPPEETLVNLYGGVSLEDMARLLRVNVGKLARINPQLKGVSPQEDLGLTQIFIPTDRLGYYRAYYRPPMLHEIYRDKHYAKLIAHVVRPQETLKSIAREYHVTPLDLVIANSLRVPAVRPGKVLMVPVTQEEYERRLRY